jgi:hypothetical protein
MDTQTYSVFVVKEPEDHGGGLAFFMRRDGEYSRVDEMLVWSGLTLDQALEKRDLLKKRHFS